MTEEVITVLLYAQLDDELGPSPLVWFPTNYPPHEIMHIVIKVIAVLSGEQGLVPESVLVLPFPTLKLKGLIKYIMWDDPNRRGGIGQSAIALLFREFDDAIFYKYMDQLNLPFGEITQKIINLEKEKAPKETYSELLEEFELNLSNLLEELKNKEEVQAKEFPEQKIKEAGLIDYKFKIAIVGDPGVGKTSLILRYTNNAFRRSYIPTLGVHVSDKIFKVKDSTVQLVLWDIAGQVKFETMRQQFYLGSDAVLLVFDLTNEKSFENLSNWYLDVKNQLKNRPELVGFIVGNKKDLIEELKISAEKAIELANSQNLGYIETSALTGENVDSAFNDLANKLYNTFK
ncbi:MAG: Rab family GTPase [Candidatus Hermodarchaeota archaeon]